MQVIQEIGRLSGRPLYGLVPDPSVLVESCRFAGGFVNPDEESVLKYEMKVSVSGEIVTTIEELAWPIYETHAPEFCKERKTPNGNVCYYTEINDTVYHEVKYRKTDTVEKRGNKLREAKKVFEIKVLKTREETLAYMKRELWRRIQSVVEDHNRKVIFNCFNGVKGKVLELESALVACTDGRLSADVFSDVVNSINVLCKAMGTRCQEIVCQIRSGAWK